MTQTKTTKHQILIWITLLLGILIAYHLRFMLSAFLGGITLYILLKPYYKMLIIKKQWNQNLAFACLALSSFLIIFLPFYFVSVFLFNKVEPLVSNPQPIIDGLSKINQYLSEQFDFQLLSTENYKKIIGLIQTVLPKLLNSSLNILSSILLMYFLLWFMLTYNKTIEQWLRRLNFLPKIKQIAFYKMVQDNIKSNAIGIYILAIVQALFAFLGYLIFGVSEPLVWGCITGLASVIPIVGTMAAWVPIGVLTIANGHIGPGIGVLIYGLIVIGGSDNVFRFLLQKKLASTPALVTILGVFFGLNLLGFWGLIYGPVLILVFLFLYGFLSERE